MTAIKKLLHADVGAETYSYEIEETAEHVTVARLARGAHGGWKYEVTARRTAHGTEPDPGRRGGRRGARRGRRLRHARRGDRRRPRAGAGAAGGQALSGPGGVGQGASAR